MVRWLAPILSFTAEEIWRPCRARAAESVFLSRGRTCRCAETDGDRAWTGRAALQVRGAVLRELERLRVAGAIGAPLDAVSMSTADARDRARRWRRVGEELRFVLITSEARVHPADARPPTRWRRTRRRAGFWLHVQPSAAREVRALLAQAR